MLDGLLISSDCPRDIGKTKQLLICSVTWGILVHKNPFMDRLYLMSVLDELCSLSMYWHPKSLPIVQQFSSAFWTKRSVCMPLYSFGCLLSLCCV